MQTEPSLIHYTRDNSKPETSMWERENFIHRQSKVPLKHSAETSANEYRKVVAPFAGVSIDKNSPQTQRSENMEQERRKAIQDRFRKVYESPKQQSSHSKRPSQDRTQPSAPAPVVQEVKNIPPTPQRKNSERVVSTPSGLHTPAPVPMENPVIVKHERRESEAAEPAVIEHAERPSFPPRPNTNINDNKELSTTKSKPVLLVKHEAERTRIEKLRKELEKSGGSNSTRTPVGGSFAANGRMSSARDNKPKDRLKVNNFINDEFGIEHGKLMEQQKEQERERVRKEVLNKMLKDRYLESANRKDVL